MLARTLSMAETHNLSFSYRPGSQCALLPAITQPCTCPALYSLPFSCHPWLYKGHPITVSSLSTPSPDAKAKGCRGQQAGRWPSRLNESRSALNSRAPFDYPDWGLPWFSSVVSVFVAKSQHGPHPLPQGWRPHLSAWQTSHNSSMRQSQSGLGTHTANQPKFIPPTLSPG